jgi:hypothetical protein
MRFIGLLLVAAVTGLACEKNQTPSNGGRPAVSNTAMSNVESSPAINGDDTNTNGAVATAKAAQGHPADAPASSPALSKSARAGESYQGEGIGEPMDDDVPVTDRSGAAALVPEHAGSEGMEVELEE